MPDAGTPLKRLMDLMRSEVRVCGVARVRRYVPGEPTADVDLWVQEDRDLSTGRQEVAPISMDGCPVLWPAGGGRAFTMGLRDGDFVLAMYRHRSHDEIDAGQEGPLVPASTRRMSVSDVVVLPGYVVPATGLAAGAFAESGEPVLSMPNGEVFHVGDSGATYTLARTDLVMDRLDAIHTAVSGHTHGPGAFIITDPVSGPLPVTGISAAGATYAAPTGVASDRIKVDS